MSPSELFAFLSSGARTGKLATVRADGRPHLAPVWFVVEGAENDWRLVFTTWYTTVKGANLRRDPRLALLVEDEQPPYAFVSVEGTATIDERAPDLLAWTTRIAARYMGPDLAEAYGRRNGVEGEWLVRVTPVKVIALSGIAE